MKPETTLTKDQLENFSIDVVNSFEGCPEAIVFLKKIYGNATDDLRKRRRDFEALINAGKQIWIMNFVFNMVTKPYRARFVSNVVVENLYLIEKEETKKAIVTAFQEIQEYARTRDSLARSTIKGAIALLKKERDEVKQIIQAIGAQVSQPSQEYFEDQMSLSQFLKGIILYLEDYDGSLTRTGVKFFQCLGEALQWRYIRETDQNILQISLQSYASQLLDFTEIFVES